LPVKGFDKQPHASGCAWLTEYESKFGSWRCDITTDKVPLAQTWPRAPSTRDRGDNRPEAPPAFQRFAGRYREIQRVPVRSTREIVVFRSGYSDKHLSHFVG
jgi:hypothetical protein